MSWALRPAGQAGRGPAPVSVATSKATRAPATTGRDAGQRRETDGISAKPMARAGVR